LKSRLNNFYGLLRAAPHGPSLSADDVGHGPCGAALTDICIYLFFAK